MSNGNPQQWQDEAVIADLVRNARTIAVVGLSSNPRRPSHGVARYLQQQGYRIIPVNPNEVEVLGERSYPSLAEVPEPIDIVDVFRRPEYTPEIAKDAVAVGANALWLQMDIINEDAARIAADGGLKVVMDRCLMVEHQRVMGAPR